MPFPKIKLADDSGNAVSVTSNRLDVNAYLSATPTIDIGDVSLLLGGTAADTGLGTYGAQTLRVTMAADDVLLSAMNINLVDIETLLTTIDSDTGTISTYAEAIFTDMDALSRSTGNVATTAGHKGIGALAVRNDTLEAYAGIADGDYTFLQASSIGALYVTGAEVENAAVQSQPSLIGGRYDSSARTLGDGDAGAVALNASGHMLMDVVDGGQLDTIIDTLETTLTAIETDQAALEVLSTAANVDLAAMEALLITIDSDTDAIKTAVEILDNAISGSEMQVDIVSSATLSVNSHAVTNAGTFAVQAGHDITGLASDDNDTVGTSAEKISGADGDVACKRVDIMAHPDNTGYIWIGDSAVSVNGLNGGIRLSPGDFYSMDIDNTGDVYAIATVNGENVCFNYFT